MTRRLLIAASPGEVRACLADDDQPLEYWIERLGEGSRIGDIHLGRVLRILPELPAALIDIGDERPAFLSAEDAIAIAPPEKRAAGIAAWLTEGQSLLVQVARDPQGEKALGVTTQMRISAFPLVYTPRRGKFVLPKGTPEAGRDAMGFLQQALQEGEGLIVPEAALAMERGVLLGRLELARRSWKALQEKAAVAEPPALLTSAEDPVSRILSQALNGEAGPAPEEILVEHHWLKQALRRFLREQRPDAAGPMEAELQSAVFEHFGLTDALDSLSEPRIALPGGGALTIETTQAMTIIDVDSGQALAGRGDGGRNILALNKRAAKAAAQQIRLRSLSGAIVIDFVSMRRREDRDSVQSCLAEAMKDDPAAPQILGWTRLGHLEVTRRRTRRPLHEILFEPRAGAALTKTAVTIAFEALNAAAREARQPGVSPVIRAHPDILAALAGPANRGLRELEDRIARQVPLREDPQAPRRGFEIERTPCGRDAAFYV